MRPAEVRKQFMAKMSRKPPMNQPSIETDSMSQFIFEGLEDQGPFGRPETMTQVPNVDMFSTATELIIEAELPGVKKEDISVTIENNTVCIKAVKLECVDEGKVNYVCMERTFGRVYRTVEIPFPVDTSNIKAVFRDGVLSISIPKVKDKRCTVKKIPIDSL